MISPRSAIIVGAGIGGLTIALILARAGWNVEIFEQSERLEPVGAGVQLSPNASRILIGLGLEDALASSAVEPAQLTIRSGTSGRTLSTVAQGKTARSRWGAPFQVIHRGDLQSILLDAVHAEPNVMLALGHRLDELRERGDQVRATFVHGSGELQRETRLLIAADGLWSKARGYVGLSQPANFSGCVAWRALVPVGKVAPFAAALNSNLWLAHNAHVVHYPVRSGNEVNIVAIMADTWRDNGWSEIGDRAWINRHAREWAPELRQLIATAEQWRRWSLFDRAPDPKWSRGAVTLLGDAAHPMLPFMAQGAAQAIEDAAVLGASLTAAADIAAAFQRYEALRIRRTARVQRQSRRQMHLYHAGAPLALLRDIGMRALGPAGLARTYDWLYGHTSARDA